MNVGQRIRMRREQLGLSQEELAKMLGYRNRSSVNKIELAGYKIPSGKIMEFADALQVTPAYLMGWEDLDGNEITAQVPKTLVQQLFDRLDKAEQEEIIAIMQYKLDKKKDTGKKAKLLA